MKTYFTSESVTCGHPDKVCDQIADAVLDDILANDPDAHVACEVTACTGEVHLMGEISSSYVPDYEAIARKVIAEIGYTVPVVGFDADQILHVGTMTADEALAQGLTDAVSFRTHDGLASSLIINGEVQSKNLGGGVNPRTAIGQCADGSVLLLVLDGRSINTLGATMQDVADIMLEYGAVNAGNLDGGASSDMYFNGEYVNVCNTSGGPRGIPTAVVVMPAQ